MRFPRRRHLKSVLHRFDRWRHAVPSPGEDDPANSPSSCLCFPVVSSSVDLSRRHGAGLLTQLNVLYVVAAFEGTSTSRIWRCISVDREGPQRGVVIDEVSCGRPLGRRLVLLLFADVVYNYFVSCLSTVRFVAAFVGVVNRYNASLELFQGSLLRSGWRMYTGTRIKHQTFLIYFDSFRPIVPEECATMGDLRRRENDTNQSSLQRWNNWGITWVRITKKKNK